MTNQWCQCIHLKNWEEFVNLLNNTKGFFMEYSNDKGFIWRGQGKCESWKLETTLSRLLSNENASSVETADIHLEYFKYALRGKISKDINELTEDDIWAIGQHYGLATPLLDWTFSPYIAAYFAYEYEYDPMHKQERRVIYAIQSEFVEKRLNNSGIKMVYPLTNYNKRLIHQNGVFLKIPIGITLEEEVRKHYSNDDGCVFYKIILEEDEYYDRNTVLMLINRMNINPLTLFPDMDGSAKYCNMKLKQFLGKQNEGLSH